MVGAGPAGLTAAYELIKNGFKPIILEKGDKVGGLARTEVYKGYRFDIGGHRFYTKIPEIQQLWQEMLKEKFIKVARMSRIYYRGKFFNYPLNIFNALKNMGLWESVLIVLSYLKAQLLPRRREETFEDWVSNRFGDRLYRIFFKTYTEKVWGIACNRIQAEWAAQRIKGLSLFTAVANAVFGKRNVKSLIEEFHYPELGPGMMWERFGEWIERQGGEVHLNTETLKVCMESSRVRSVRALQNGREVEYTGDYFVSSMPINELVLAFDPLPPAEIVDAASRLSYRDFIIVSLVLNRSELFPDNWIYVHTQNVKVGRIQNFKNWSVKMVPDPERTCVGMEYFTTLGDELWSMTDEQLIDLARREIEQIGLARSSEVMDGVVIRQLKAYPVYDTGYFEHLRKIREFLSGIENFQTIGRNGMHHYNNQDHSMLTGILAARNILGEKHDLWEVNTERSYYEEFMTNEKNSHMTEGSVDS